LGANEQVERAGFPIWLLILIIVIGLSILAAVVVIVVRGEKRSNAGAIVPAPVWQPAHAVGKLRGVVCTKCGLELHERRTSFCPGCGNRLPEGARFCANCGRPA
jgi:hypothetical protein